MTLGLTLSLLGFTAFVTLLWWLRREAFKGGSETVKAIVNEDVLKQVKAAKDAVDEFNADDDYAARLRDKYRRD